MKIIVETNPGDITVFVESVLYSSNEALKGLKGEGILLSASLEITCRHANVGSIAGRDDQIGSAHSKTGAVEVDESLRNNKQSIVLALASARKRG